MKFVKGVAVVLVLCLAAYGAYTLLNRPANLTVSEDERAYLKDFGIYILDNAGSESGLSAVLGDVQGVAPIGAANGTTSSSAPPSFFAESPTSYAPPPFAAQPAPLVASQATEPRPQPAPEVHMPIPFEPVGSPSPTPPPFLTVPFETSPFELQQPLEIQPSAPSAFEALPVSATESPPPWEENWDGPASTIPVLSPPVNSFQPLNSSPLTTKTAPRSEEKNTYITSVDRIRRIASSSDQHSHAPAESLPNRTTPTPGSQYVRTATRQSSVLEPVVNVSASSSGAPMVAFAAPKRVDPAPQIEQIRQIDALQLPIQEPVVAAPVESRNELSYPVENLAGQPDRSGSVEHFIQMQLAKIETDDPEDIRSAFIQLSQLYEEKRLSESERAMLSPILDVLALKVIYARNMHILEPPYQSKPGDTIDSIAKDYCLPSVLLRKINGLTATYELPPGTTLKVVFGQFDANISVKRKEITLLLGGLYAGKFSFLMPNPGIPVPSGEFYVTKRTDGMLVLNNGMTLSTLGTRDATFVFTDQDAREIFDILSEQSVIVFQ